MSHKHLTLLTILTLGGFTLTVTTPTTQASQATNTQEEASNLKELSNAALKKLMRSGNLHAEVEWAYRMKEGHTADYDSKFIFNTFKKGAEANIISAGVGLGECYRSGIGVKKDLIKALPYLEKGVKANNPIALYSYAYYHINGWVGIQKDRKKGLEYLKQSAELGYTEARVSLIAEEWLTPTQKPNLAEQIKELEQLSHLQTGRFASYWLGNYYMDTKQFPKALDAEGNTVSPAKRKQLAKDYFAASAKFHHSRAMHAQVDTLIGKYRGLSKPVISGSPEARVEALTILRELASREDNFARLRLGIILGHYKKLAQEGESWYQYFLDGHASGDLRCSWSLMEINYNAPGYYHRDLDWNLTVKYANHIIETSLEKKKNGEPYSYSYIHNATHYLCLVYYFGGRGAKRDYHKCIESCKRFRGSCEQITSKMGLILLDPDSPMGTARENYIRGYACMIRARQLGYEISDDALYIMSSRHGMSRSEIASAEQLVKNGFPNPSTPLLPE